MHVEQGIGDDQYPEESTIEIVEPFKPSPFLGESIEANHGNYGEKITTTSLRPFTDTYFTPRRLSLHTVCVGKCNKSSTRWNIYHNSVTPVLWSMLQIFTCNFYKISFQAMWMNYSWIFWFRCSVISLNVILCPCSMRCVVCIISHTINWLHHINYFKFKNTFLVWIIIVKINE